MSENDFLYALKDDLPQEFLDNLREQLRQIEYEEQFQNDNTQPKQTQGTWWLLAVASILVAIFGVIFFFSNQPNMDVLNIAQQLPPTITNHGEITPETIGDLQRITALGDGFARRIRLSPDGETLAVESSAGLYLHDANNLNAEPRLIVVPENFGIIDYVDDGTIYGVIFNYTQEETQQIIQIDPETSQITVLFDLSTYYLSNFEISADGSRLFMRTCSPEAGDYCEPTDWVTQVYNTETGTLALEFQAIFRPGYFLSAYGSYSEASLAHVSQDGSQYVYLVRGDNGYVIHLMNVDTGQSQAILRLGTEVDLIATQWIQLAPDKQTLILSRHQQVTLWDIDRLLASDTLIDAKVDEPNSDVSMDTRLTNLFYPDENTLIGISDNIIRNYDIITGEAESVFESDLAGASIMNTLEISPEGDAIFGLLATGELVRYSYPEGLIEEISNRYDTGWAHQFFFREGNLLTAGNSFSGTFIREWSLDNNEPSDEIFQPNGGIIYPIRPEIILSPDGRYMNYSGQQVEDNTSTFNWLHDLETGERHRMSVFFADRGGIITPDNRLIGLGTNISYVYDIENILNNENFNQEYRSFYLEREYINSWYLPVVDDYALSTDGNMMATLPCVTYNPLEEDTYCETGIVLWDLDKGDAIFTLNMNTIMESFSSVGLSSDSQLLGASACVINEEDTRDCNSFYLYNVSEIPENDSGDVLELDIEPTAILENLTHDVRTIRFHPTTFADGSRIVALSDNRSLTTFVKITSDGTIEQLATLPIQGAVTYSPNGNLVFANNRRGQIEIWGVSIGRPEPLAQNNSEDLGIQSREVITAQNLNQAEEILALGNGHAYHMALSSDDQNLAVASNGIYLHDAQNLNAEPQFIGSPSEGIRYLEYAENGDLYVVAVADYNETLSLHRWDESSSQFISLYSISGMSDKTIQHIDISPNGSQLLIATCNTDNGVISVAPHMYCQSPAQVGIQLIDLNNPENPTAISTQNTSNAVVAVNPDWTQIAYYDNGSIYLYDMATGNSKRVIEIVTSEDSYSSTGLPHELSSLYFTPDGSELAFLGTANGDFELWSIDELNQVEHDNPLVRQEDVSNFPSTWTAILAFHPQTNDRLVSRSDTIAVYSANDGTRLDEFSSTWRPRALELSSDGERLYTLSATGAIQVWEWSTREQIDRNIVYTLGFRMSVSVSEDSQFVVNNNNGNGDSMSFIWNTNTNNEDPQIPLTDDSSMQPVTATAISPNNRYIAYEQSNQLYVYDREMNEQRQIDFVLSLIDLEFRDDNSLVTLTLEGGAVLIKAYPPEMLATGDVSYPYDGIRIEDLVFSGSYSGSPSPYARLVTLSPNANLIAVTHCNNMVSPFLEPVNCDSRISSLVDTHTGEILTDLHSALDFEGYHESLVFSADGNYIAMNYCTDTLAPRWACIDNQGAIDIWHIADIQDGQLDPLVTIADIPYHQSEMSFIAYEDGSLLLEASDWEPVSGDIYEPFTRFWSITADGTATEIQRIQANVIGFSPDGRMMIILEDGQIKLWAIPRDMSTVSSD